MIPLLSIFVAIVSIGLFSTILLLSIYYIYIHINQLIINLLDCLLYALYIVYAGSNRRIVEGDYVQKIAGYNIFTLSESLYNTDYPISSFSLTLVAFFILLRNALHSNTLVSMLFLITSSIYQDEIKFIKHDNSFRNKEILSELLHITAIFFFSYQLSLYIPFYFVLLIGLLIIFSLFVIMIERLFSINLSIHALRYSFGIIKKGNIVVVEHIVLSLCLLIRG